MHIPIKRKLLLKATHWRGLKLKDSDDKTGDAVSLIGGKKYWDHYKEQDKQYLSNTGIGKVLIKHQAKYINITHEYWSNKCVDQTAIQKILGSNNILIRNTEFLRYIPQEIFDIRRKSTLISLSKIKIEESIPGIYISMSVKNLFGLIPDPSRYIPYHNNNHQQIPEAINDIYSVYISIFIDTLWITEGIKTLVKNYCEDDQQILKNQRHLFIGRNALKVDSSACEVLVTLRMCPTYSLLPPISSPRKINR